MRLDVLGGYRFGDGDGLEGPRCNPRRKQDSQGATESQAFRLLFAPASAGVTFLVSLL